MTSQRDYFAYHPRRLRLWLIVSAVASVALTAWAVVGAARGAGVGELLRAGVSGALCAAMLTVWVKLKPREGWGVRVGPMTLRVAGPIDGADEVPWTQVRGFKRLGRKRNLLQLQLEGDAHLVVSGHLFADPSEFESLVSAIEDRMPPSPYDA